MDASLLLVDHIKDTVFDYARRHQSGTIEDMEQGEILHMQNENEVFAFCDLLDSPEFLDALNEIIKDACGDSLDEAHEKGELDFMWEHYKSLRSI